MKTNRRSRPNTSTAGADPGSAGADNWPLLNALLNASCGADLVTIHQGGGSGMGGSISAGHILIADGSDSAERRFARCLHVDPGMA